MTGDTLIEEINTAYRRLGAATEDLARADGELAEHVRQVRLDNAEAILEARNERTAKPLPRRPARHRRARGLEAGKARAELDLQASQDARSNGCN